MKRITYKQGQPGAAPKQHWTFLTGYGIIIAEEGRLFNKKQRCFYNNLIF